MVRDFGNQKYFNAVQKLRRKGIRSWLSKMTISSSFCYVLSTLIVQFTPSNNESIYGFLIDHSLIYVIHTVIMFFLFWGMWLFNEAIYQKEVKRRSE